MDYSEFIASIQALVAALAVWRDLRNDRVAQDRYAKVYKATLDDPRTADRAKRLQGVLPSETARIFRNNIQKCLERFNKCIEDKSDPSELKACERDNNSCICANLKTLLRNNGCLPEDLEPLWDVNNCGPAPKIC